MTNGLTAALDRAIRALDRGDAVAATADVEAAAVACSAAARDGVRLDPGELARLRDAYARCQSAAARAGVALQRALESAGTARRATRAYGG